MSYLEIFLIANNLFLFYIFMSINLLALPILMT